MSLQSRIHAFAKLGNFLLKGNAHLDKLIEQTELHNNWFMEENTRFALQGIAAHFLNEGKLIEWIDKYSFQLQGTNHKLRTIGIVMAGNIPLVGFHDFLCTLISGNAIQLKLSSKDKFIPPFLAEKLTEIDVYFKNKIHFAERLKNFDAVIATGSNNSARYFEYYFGKYPHIIRRNRSSVAVLNGKETEEELTLLGKDIFQYFGLGCRNVSKLYVPKGYKFDEFFNAIVPYKKLIEHNKYKNNYDYNRTILLMNKIPHLDNELLMLVEKEEIASPVATLHYEFYKEERDLKKKLEKQKDNIQCIVSHSTIPFGKTQEPELWDYADNVDTMKFLLGLN